MKILKVLGFTALVMAAGTSSNAGIIYADSVESYTAGTGITSSSRKITGNALGVADGKFLTLGVGGEAIFRFGKVIAGVHKTLSITEVTWGDRAKHPESIDVYFGLDDVFTFLGSTTNAAAVNLLDITGTFNQIKLVDTSDGTISRDGYDIDAISISPVPVPAAGLMLLSALGLASLLRRRKA